MGAEANSKNTNAKENIKNTNKKDASKLTNFKDESFMYEDYYAEDNSRKMPLKTIPEGNRESTYDYEDYDDQEEYVIP